MFQREPEYDYPHSPDGEDTLEKLWFMTKFAGAASCLAGVVDVVFYARPTQYGPIIQRFLYISVPYFAMGMSFTAISNIAGAVRGKDDKLNWVIGACASGGICGAWQRRPAVGVMACVILSGFAALKKHAIQNDWTLLETPRPQTRNLDSHRWDFTLTEERPQYRNWVAGPATTKK